MTALSNPSPFFLAANKAAQFINTEDELEELMAQLHERLELLREFPASLPLAPGIKSVDCTLYQLALVECLAYVEETKLDKFSSSLIRKRLVENHARQVGNITTTMEPLEENGWIEIVSGREINKHKLYSLTAAGREEALKLREALRKPIGPVLVKSSA